MALIRDYELPGTGVTVANAYHVVTKVDVEKRFWWLGELCKTLGLVQCRYSRARHYDGSCMGV